MLLIPGRPRRRCGVLNRRSFLQIGGWAGASLTLADLLKAQASTSRHKSVIVVFLPGGPSHLDLVDLKPEAPIEVRGEFRPIATSVPGIQISELLPRLAARMEHLVAIRTIVGGPDDHACHMCLTGHSRLGPQPPGQWPSLGAVVARMQGMAHPGVPAAMGLAAKMLHPPYNDPGPGFLGAAFTPFSPDGESRDNMILHGVAVERLGDRQTLLGALDRFRRSIDESGLASGMDAFQQQALGLLTGSRLIDALDLSQEDSRTRERYGAGDSSLVEGFNAAPKPTQQFLLARRLVEAGVRCVTLAFGAWDWHEKNFSGLRQETPLLDQGLAALIDDLHERGLQDDVAVVIWGEFGRTPRINKTAGRDHWPGTSCALLAGGGWRTGQVIGVTNRLGEVPVNRPVHVQEVFASVYRHLGIDPATALADRAGRPQPLVDLPRPVVEL
ncbi:MAG: DUF1501 domain-containing protein [Planctomycetales bacterium]